MVQVFIFKISFYKNHVIFKLMIIFYKLFIGTFLWDFGQQRIKHWLIETAITWNSLGPLMRQDQMIKNINGLERVGSSVG